MSGHEVAFKREVRYVVFKLSDIKEYGEDSDMHVLRQIGESIAYRRRVAGKPPFNAVVVEQDWPEFDIVWKMIEDRMTGVEIVDPVDVVARLLRVHEGRSVQDSILIATQMLGATQLADNGDKEEHY